MNKYKRLDAAWKAWLQENLDRRCEAQELAGILIKNGFSLESIKESMGSSFPAGVQLADSDLPVVPLGTSACDYAAIAEPPLVRRQALLKLKRVPVDNLQLYTLDDFLTDAESDAIVAIANRHLRPSTVTLQSGDKYFRTSRTCDLSLLNSNVVEAIDKKIARTLGIRQPYSEGIQAQRYNVGEQFKQHTDYFEPGTAEYARYAADRGNRTWTFMVYLNQDMAGGGTRFCAADTTLLPKKGQAVIWNNLYRDGTPNPNTLHSGNRVLAGHKIIITKWFREKGSDRMFYDD